MLAIDYYRCKKIIKENSKSFYQAFATIATRKKRNAIYAIYAFCRKADDIADIDHNLDKLYELEHELNIFEKKQVAKGFIFRALKDVNQSFPLQYQPFHDMIEGQKRDLLFQEIKTESDLLDYSYYVASSVGLMLLPILSSQDYKKASPFAINLGYAMQITNILRDVGEDYRMNRIYLPTSWLNQYGYTKENLANHVINDAFIKLWEHGAKLAENFYQKALNDIDLIDADSRKALYYALRFYKEILNACRRASYQVFTKRNYVTLEEKNKIINALMKEVKL